MYIYIYIILYHIICMYIYILFYIIYTYIYIYSRHSSISKFRRFALPIFTSVAIVTPALWSGFLLTLCIKLYDSLPCYIIIQAIISINNLHQFNLIVRFVPNNILCFTVFSNGSSSTK